MKHLFVLLRAPVRRRHWKQSLHMENTESGWNSASSQIFLTAAKCHVVLMHQESRKACSSEMAPWRMGRASGGATHAETPQNAQWVRLEKCAIVPSRPWGGVKRQGLLRTAHLGLQAGDQFRVGRLEKVNV